MGITSSFTNYEGTRQPELAAVPTKSNAFSQAITQYSLENSLELCEKEIAKHLIANDGKVYGTTYISVPISFQACGYAERDEYFLQLRTNLSQVLGKKYGWRCGMINNNLLGTAYLEIQPRLVMKEL